MLREGCLPWGCVNRPGMGLVMLSKAGLRPSKLQRAGCLLLHVLLQAVMLQWKGAEGQGCGQVRKPPCSPGTEGTATKPGSFLWPSVLGCSHNLSPPNACASLEPTPVAQAQLSDAGSNFVSSACSFFPALSALQSQGIPGSSGWILFGLTHHHQACRLIQAEGDDV